MICANPSCQYHIEVPSVYPQHAETVKLVQRESMYAAPEARVEDYKPRYVEIRRYRYISGYNRTVTYLCGCCHAAVRLVNG